MKICKRGAYKVWNYRNTVDFIGIIFFVPSTFFMKLRIFVSIKWYNYRIPSKFYINCHFTASKIVNSEYLTTYAPPRESHMHTIYLVGCSTPLRAISFSLPKILFIRNKMLHIIIFSYLNILSTPWKLKSRLTKVRKNLQNLLRLHITACFCK